MTDHSGATLSDRDAGGLDRDARGSDGANPSSQRQRQGREEGVSRADVVGMRYGMRR